MTTLALSYSQLTWKMLRPSPNWPRKKETSASATFGLRFFMNEFMVIHTERYTHFCPCVRQQPQHIIIFQYYYLLHVKNLYVKSTVGA